MSKVQEAVDCFCSGAACSQAILATYGQELGLARSQAMKLASAFAGGMCLGETCGVVTGAFMVLGLARAADDCDRRDSRDDVHAVVADFVKRFEKRNNVIVCKELLGCDISTPQGVSKATRGGLFGTVCPKLVRDAAEILEEML